MRFPIDAQLPPALANWLEDQGHHAEHVAALGLEGAEDPDIWVKACALDAILITKDEDFVVIRERAAAGPAIVWLRIGNATNRVLIAWLTKSFPAAVAALQSGVPIVEIT